MLKIFVTVFEFCSLCCIMKYIWEILFILPVKGAIQFRIKQSELNKVASVLQSTYSYDVDLEHSKPKVIQNNTVYEIEELQKEFNGEEVQIKIPVDGRADAVVKFSSVHLKGRVRVKSSSDGDVIGNENFDVTLKHVTLVSQYYLGQNFSQEDHATLHFDFTNCSADIETFSSSVESAHNIRSQIREDNQKTLFQNALCHAYAIQFNLGFGAFGVSCRIFQRQLLIATENCGLEIRNKTFIITQEVKATSTHGTLLPAFSADNSLPLPSQDATSQPFEIVLNVDIINSLFRDLKKDIGIGDEKLTIGDIIPTLKNASAIDTEGPYMTILFPRVKDTYPDAVGRIVVLDADIYIKVTDESLQLHVDITSNMLITLNCDKSKTYSAFNFTMNLYFPAQIGFDNRYITFKLFGFGGKFTVLNSTVGHIVDRAARVFLSSVPSYTESTFSKLNDHLKGIPLTDFLPEGVFATVKSISLKKDFVVVGGGLTLIDPQLPLRKKSDVSWVGKSVSMDDFHLLGLDRTPEDLKPEEEKNCTKPESTSRSSFITNPTVLLCIMNVVVWFC